MNSTILQIADRYVRWLLLLFALIALLRGHDYPGGGFIAGLLAGLSLVFKGYAYDPEVVSEKLSIRPHHIMGIGLMLILVSVLWPVLYGKAILTGLWAKADLLWLGTLKLGTPLLFDLGVFVAVIGVTLMFLLTLKK